MKRVRVVSMALMPGSSVIRRVRPGEIIEVPDECVGNWFVELASEAAGAVDGQAADEPPKRGRRARSFSDLNQDQQSGPIVT